MAEAKESVTMFMKDFSATLLIPTSIRESRRDARRRVPSEIEPGRRAARKGHVVDAIVAGILHPRLG